MRGRMQGVVAAAVIAVVCGSGCVAIISSRDRCRGYDECSDCHGVTVVVGYKCAPQDSAGTDTAAPDPAAVSALAP